MPSKALLSPREIYEICKGLTSLGLQRIRVTGGEPTVRREFGEIMTLLGSLALEKFGLTTNGHRLAPYLPLLKEVGCSCINISLDSLSGEKFRVITGSDTFETVFMNILKSKELGFSVKVNVVMLKGLNDDEFFDFIEFSGRYGIPVRFLELMKIGEGSRYHSSNFLSAAEAIEKIRVKEDLKKEAVEFDSTSFDFETSSGGKIAFIASETQPFCGSCSRLRLSAGGVLRACLMSPQGISLKGVLQADYPALLEKVMAMKPTGRLSHVDQPMYQIGG